MKGVVFPLFACTLGLSACAGARLHKALGEQTDGYVYAKSLQEVWPAAPQVLQAHHFLGTPNGPYRLETAAMTRDGQIPTMEGAPPGGPGNATPGSPGAGRGGGGKHATPSQAADHSGSETVRFVVEGEAVDGKHCKVRIVRFTRDNLDAPESDGIRDVDLEWELINRVEPEQAARIRGTLEQRGLHAP
jgi:hypothetical protein